MASLWNSWRITHRFIAVLAAFVVLKYKFSNLKGIIFGIKTEDEDKRKIFEIVKSKGRTENDFEFFQAFYNPKTGKIDKFALPLFEASQLCKRK